MDDKKTKLKQARNLYNTLTRNENSVFYDTDRITKMQMNKIKKSHY